MAAAIGARFEHEQRGQVGAAVADGAGVGDQRARGLELGLDARGRDVLAARGDDQLLLAVDDAQVAGRRRACRCRRCAASRRRRSASSPRRRGSRASASAAHEDLAVVGEPELDAVERAADASRSAARHGGRPRRAAGLRQRVALAAARRRWRGRTRARRGRSGPRRCRRREPGRGRAARAGRRRARRRRGRPPCSSACGTGSPACWSRTRCRPAAIAACAASRRSGGCCASACSMPALSFSHTRGTAMNRCGRTRGRYSAIVRGSAQVVVSKPSTSATE